MRIDPACRVVSEMPVYRPLRRVGDPVHYRLTRLASRLLSDISASTPRDVAGLRPWQPLRSPNGNAPRRRYGGEPIQITLPAIYDLCARISRSRFALSEKPEGIVDRK